MFVGIKNHYFDFYGIQEFFNVVFVDSQNFWAFLLAAPLLGYLFFYSPVSRIVQFIYIGLLAASFLFFIPSLAHSVAKSLYYQPDVLLTIDNRIEIYADVFYVGRSYVHFRERGREEVERLHKDRVSGEFEL